jgi:hypothetical protein
MSLDAVTVLILFCLTGGIFRDKILRNDAQIQTITGSQNHSNAIQGDHMTINFF